MQETSTHHTLHYEATKFTYFSFYIALLTFNGSVIGLRAVVTREHGVVLVKANMELNDINGKVSVPAKYRMNTAFIMGMRPKSFSCNSNWVMRKQ